MASVLGCPQTTFFPEYESLRSLIDERFSLTAEFKRRQAEALKIVSPILVQGQDMVAQESVRIGRVSPEMVEMPGLRIEAIQATFRSYPKHMPRGAGDLEQGENLIVTEAMGVVRTV